MASRGRRGSGPVRRTDRGGTREVPSGRRSLIKLLLVSHSRAGHTAELAEAVLGGARGGLEAGSEIAALDCFEAGPADVLSCDGILLGTPARFGYMSGAMKDFLERIYHPCLEAECRLPYGLFVKGDTDTSGAVTSVERIVSGMRWRRVLPVLEVVGELGSEDKVAAGELGAALAAGLEAGIF